MYTIVGYAHYCVLTSCANKRSNMMTMMTMLNCRRLRCLAVLSAVCR